MSESISLIHLVWLALPLLVAVLLLSPRGKGQVVESRATRLLASGLSRSEYTLLADFPLTTAAGDRRIPLLIVSEYGLFVGRAVNRRGRITGTEVQDRWTQDYLGRKQSFDNPLYQADLDMQALQRNLDINGSRFHPFAVFPDATRFSCERPGGVISAAELAPFIRRRGDDSMCSGFRRNVVSRLEKLRADQPSRTTDRNRVLVAWLMIAIVAAGTWYMYREPVSRAWLVARGAFLSESSTLTGELAGQDMAEQEQRESGLICAWSADTGRCACYEPSGKRAELAQADCVRLAEKGTVLKR